MRRQHLHLPDEITARVKACAARLELSAAEFIRRAVEAFLERNTG